MKIRLMTIDDHDSLVDLLKTTPGVALREADSKDAVKNYLDRNTNT
ncbi:hypothetical protein P0136_03805 [Lentisphaerota bacterium ZTH]|nr:hypothetical protein JYG24_05075 [Lentisphaerota bacterium]WET07124.1 hypothetical protein P0136_03805 [Lentisphaerota bacterium ZTH]